MADARATEPEAIAARVAAHVAQAHFDLNEWGSGLAEYDHAGVAPSTATLISQARRAERAEQGGWAVELLKRANGRDELVALGDHLREGIELHAIEAYRAAGCIDRLVDYGTELLRAGNSWWQQAFEDTGVEPDPQLLIAEGRRVLRFASHLQPVLEMTFRRAGAEPPAEDLTSFAERQLRAHNLDEALAALTAAHAPVPYDRILAYGREQLARGATNDAIRAFAAIEAREELIAVADSLLPTRVGRSRAIALFVEFGSSDEIQLMIENLWMRRDFARIEEVACAQLDATRLRALATRFLRSGESDRARRLFTAAEELDTNAA